MKRRWLDRSKTALHGCRLLVSLLVITIACLTGYWLSRGWWPARAVHAQGGNAPTFTTFDAKDAGTVMLQGTVGTSINASGEVAGIYLTAPNVAHGFVRAADGTITEFDTPHAGTGLNQGTFPASINASGDITGFFSDTNVAYRGFVRSSAGAITEFDFPSAPTTTKHRGTSPTSINTGGDITGFYRGVDDVIHGFVRSGATGSFTSFDIPTAGTAATQGTLPFSINASGMIAGSYTDANHVFHGFVGPAAGPFTTFDPPGSTGSQSGITKKVLCCGGTFALSIDAAGDVAGIYTDANAVAHGFVRAANGTFTAPIDAPGASTTSFFAGTLGASINSSGVLVGDFEDANGAGHAFVRAAGGTITGPLSAPKAGSRGMGPLPGGTAAVSIGDSGMITGGYFDSTFVAHGFVLAPEAAAPPTFNPPAGTYSGAQMVALTSTTPNASFFFTTDGSTPTDPPTGTTVAYTGPISVAASETIMAIAANPGGWFSNSTVASAAYTINPNQGNPDFTVAVNPTTLTIVAGQSGMATFRVTPENGFNSQVSFSCSGLPAGAKCGFNPPNVTPNGSSVSTALMVTTTAPSALLRLPAPPSLRLIYASSLLLSAVAITFGFAARRRRPLRALLPLGVVFLLAAGSGLVSCGGGSSGNPGTPAGTTTASVSAAAGGNTHSAMLTITITN